MAEKLVSPMPLFAQSALVYFRIVTLIPCPVSPSRSARAIASSATAARPAGVNWVTLLDRKKSFAVKPLAKRAVAPVGKTWDGPAT
jgi:hypothetical protein